MAPLVAVEANVAIHEQVAHPQLLESVRVLFGKRIRSPGVADPLDATELPITALDGHPCSAECGVALGLRGRQDIGRDCAVVRGDVPQQAAEDGISKQHAPLVGGQVLLDHFHEPIEAAEVQRAPVVPPARDRTKQNSHAIWKENGLYLDTVFFLPTGKIDS